MSLPSVVPVRWTRATLYERHGERIRCDLCPIRCMLKDGDTGSCGVRRRNGDVLETATFATSVRHLDVNERKPFYHYRPGGRSLTLAAPGCTFACDYCINHRISQYGREPAVAWDAPPADVGDLIATAVTEGADFCFSYTEPSLALELTEALVAQARPYGLRMLWKSNGFLTAEAAERAVHVVDAVNIDLKASEEAPHRRLTGAALAPVHDTIRAFSRAGRWVEVSTPLIPGISASAGQLSAIAAFIASVDPAIPWHLIRFTPTYRMSGETPTSPAALAEAVRIGRDAGLRYVYVERALGEPGRSTACPGCGHTVVRRGIWRLEELALTDGCCDRCGRSIEGAWT